MNKLLLLFSITLISCVKPIALVKCDDLLNKKVLINKDTLVIVKYTYSLLPFDGIEDEFILSNGLKINYEDIDKFLIKKSDESK